MRVVSLALPASALVVSSCSLYWAPPEPPPGPPISGGSLLVSRSGEIAVAGDPARDMLFVVDIPGRRIAHEVALEPADEPGRIAEDGDGRFHVALRGGGAVVTIDDQGNLLDRTEICAAPRGVAYQAEGDLIHVACSDGELISLPAAGGDPVRSLKLDRDIRDVVVDGADLLVSKFRSAELLRVSPDGTIASRISPPQAWRFDNFGSGELFPAIPSVAYRTIGLADGRTIMVHQRASGRPLSIQPGGYGGGGDCGDSPVEATATVFDPQGNEIEVGRRFPFAALPVDVAVAPNQTRIAVVLAGFRTVRVVNIESMSEVPGDDCGFGDGTDRELFGDPSDAIGAPTSVGFVNDDDLIILHDNAIVFSNIDGFQREVIELGGEMNLDRGRRRFHEPTFVGLACASCHPEGTQDGNVWEFAELGPRRTQNVGGNLAERAPYHWGGDMHDLPQLFNEVLVGRMGGETLSDEDAGALARFLFSLDAPAPTWSGDVDAVERGRQVFNGAGNCASCHAGEILTNNTIQDVGTGGAFKVPSLVGVSMRSPLMHDGCAATLIDRFGACGGNNHGSTGQLSAAQIADLIAYLESL